MNNPQSTLVTPEVNVITTALYSQLMSVMGLKRPNIITRCLYPIFRSPTYRMSSLLVELDCNIAQNGWYSAVNRFTSQLVYDSHLSGAEKIPTYGPLIVMSNHPAAFDIVILAAAIHREDLKIIASDIRILQLLPNLFTHIIPVPYHIPSRVQTVRSTIQHLKNGGSILIFPRGNVEPDPAVSPGAEQSLAGWSQSIELFLRRVPDALSVVAMASGMLSESWYKNPVINLWKKYEQRQKVAEVFQIASQLITGKKPSAVPIINFSAPLSVAELGGLEVPEGGLLAGLTAQARQLLSAHPRH